VLDKFRFDTRDAGLGRKLRIKGLRQGVALGFCERLGLGSGIPASRSRRTNRCVSNERVAMAAV